MSRNPAHVAIMICAICLCAACSLFSKDSSMAPKHPAELPAARPLCSECHESNVLKTTGKPFSAFDHTPAYVKSGHSLAARRDAIVCASCHAQSFCADCHAGSLPMKPSTKSDRADRFMPHRGDYMTLHRSEGKIDPTACFGCHGRANNDKCFTCHVQRRNTETF